MDDDKRLLMLRRSLSDSNNPGKWECPGGKVEKGQDPAEALVREALEETGLVVEQVNKLVFVQSFIIKDGKYKDVPYVSMCGVTRPVSGNLVISDEHVDHVWVDYNGMMELDLTDLVREAAVHLKECLT